MTRKEQVLRLADRMVQLQNDANALGVHMSSGVHALDRETFDELSWEEESFISGGRPVFTKKSPFGIVFFCNEPPVDSPSNRDLLRELERKIAYHTEDLPGLEGKAWQEMRNRIRVWERQAADLRLGIDERRAA